MHDLGSALIKHIRYNKSKAGFSQNTFSVENLRLAMPLRNSPKGIHVRTAEDAEKARLGNTGTV